MNRFVNFGGSVPLLIFGYVKPPEAKTYDDWQLDPLATPIYQEWFGRLRENPNCAAVADLLNELGIPTGKYSRSRKWTGTMVRRITRNTLLKGMPGRGWRESKKHHETLATDGRATACRTRGTLDFQSSGR